MLTPPSHTANSFPDVRIPDVPEAKPQAKHRAAERSGESGVMPCQYVEAPHQAGWGWEDKYSVFERDA